MMSPGKVDFVTQARLIALLSLVAVSFVENNSIVKETPTSDAMGSFYLGHQILNNSDINFSDICSGGGFVYKDLPKLSSLEDATPKQLVRTQKARYSGVPRRRRRASRTYYHSCKYCRSKRHHGRASRQASGVRRRVRGRSARQHVMRVPRGSFMWPINSNKFWISCYYGRRARGRLHKGLDMAAAKGTTVVATASGVVEMAGNAGTFGNMVLIRHDNGYKSRYAHLQGVSIANGRRVDKGQAIGYVGNTGRVSGENGHHLHFEILSGDRPVNPMHFLI